MDAATTLAASAVGTVLCCMSTFGSDLLWRRIKGRYREALHFTDNAKVSSVHLAGVFIGLLIGGGVGCAIAYGASDGAVLTTPGLTTIVVCLGIAACCSGFCIAFARWEYGADEEDRGVLTWTCTALMVVTSSIPAGACAAIVVCCLWFGLAAEAKRGDAQGSGSGGAGSDTGVDGQAVAITAGVLGGLAWMLCMFMCAVTGQFGQGWRALRRHEPRAPGPPVDDGAMAAV